MLSLFLLSVFAAPALTLPQNTQNGGWKVGQPVKTTSGTVNGHAASWPSNSGVSEYLGIPYAKAPVGPLRFAAPVRYSGNGTLPGNQFSADCMQMVEGFVKQAEGSTIPKDLLAFGKALIGGGNQTFSEDCLKLNIWAKPQSGDKAKAVLLWIYGGAYTIGASSAPYYSAARFAAEHDIITVSINYRLNVLGFPMASFLEEKNPGLLDQRLAIEWVRDNIAAFGGDPKRITIFGESAGSASVDYYSYAWTKEPIVSGLIAQSGTATGLAGDPPNDRHWNVVSKFVGCGEGKASLACMREAPAKKLIEGAKLLGALGGASSLLSFWPVVDNKTIFADVWDREAKGQFIKRPMLVGNMDHEGSIIVGGTNAALKWATSQAGTTGLIGLGAQSAVDYISNSETIDAVVLRFFLKFIEDGIFNCPAGTAAAARAAAGVPVWRYRFMGDWKNTLLGGVGAYHVSDVPLVMGTSELKEGASKNEPEQEVLIKNTMKAWAAFAKDPVLGLTKLGWPKYSPLGKTLVRLGYENKGTPSYGMATEYDHNCKAMKHVAPSAYNVKPN